MSRSYKKNPVDKDKGCKGSRFKSGKQIANRTVRRKDDLPNGSAYKKVYCSYNISDWSFRKTENEFKKDWDSGDRYLHKKFSEYGKALYNCLKKYYKSK